jgi:putative transposase
MRPRGGRPPLPARKVLVQVIFPLRTSCPWKALPNGSTVHRRFTAWGNQQLFLRLWQPLIDAYDDERGLDRTWSSADSATGKAPQGGTTGPNPTDRAKRGSTGHVLPDVRGIPVARTVRGANVPDEGALGKTRDSMGVRDHTGAPSRPKYLCLDKGSDYVDTEAAVRERGIKPHSRRRGEQPLVGCVQGKPRWWVVERTNSWHNPFRGLLIRWERKAAPYVARCERACALVTYRSRKKVTLRL